MTTPPQIRSALLGTIFEFGFGEISRAYHTMLSAQAKMVAGPEAIVRQRYGMASEEAVPEVEYDDDGPASFDFWEEVGEIEGEAESATRIVRAAFLIALFHFWEKHSNRWVG
jgi:hypothetical protein